MIGIRYIFCTITTMLVLSGTIDHAAACSIPVFRYAGVFWPADSYRVRIIHDGPPAGSDALLIDSLRAMTGRPGAPNISVETFDLQEDTPDDIMATWRKLGQPSKPQIILQYPISFPYNMAIWEGPLTPGAVANLVDSPARRQAAGRLIGGDVAVWLMLDGTDRDRNEKVAEILEIELSKLEKTLTLPDPVDGMYGFTDNDPVMSADLDLSFSVIRISPDDPAEEVFIAMLMHSEYDLLEYTGRPMVFPLYGRGRALYALIDAGISARTIAAAGEFLTGACSCQVKDLNPGVDMLMTADWEAMAEGISIDGPIIPMTSISDISTAGQEGVAGGTADSGAVSRESASSVNQGPDADIPAVHNSSDGLGAPLGNLLITMGSLSAVIMVLSIIITRRRSHRR